MKQDSNERFVVLLVLEGRPSFPPTPTLCTLLGNELHAHIPKVPLPGKSHSKLPPPPRINCVVAQRNDVKSLAGETRKPLNKRLPSKG